MAGVNPDDLGPVFHSLFARDMFQKQDFHSFEDKIWVPSIGII